MSRMQQYFAYLILIGFVVGVSGCAATGGKVPVKEGWRQTLTSEITYTVKPGDTLYSIAWSNGLDYRDVAKLNNISSSYQIKSGQKLRLLPPAKKSKKSAPIAAAGVSSTPAAKTIQNQDVHATAAPAPVCAPCAPPTDDLNANSTSPDTSSVAPPPVPPLKTKILAVATVANSGINWAWPARGCVVNNYCGTSFNKGIDIAGKPCSPVVAAAAGKVVYAGDGLRGYGELVIIKHNDVFLSAYAHNQRLLVVDGQSVKVGQVIALMGNTEARRVMVHFEIRKAGKPVNPLNYLPKR